MRETDLVCAILEYLNAIGHFAYRTNNVPVFDKKRGIFLKLPKYTPKGVPDIHCFLRNGKFVVIEAKSDKGVQSFDQRIFQLEVEKRGGLYILTYSIDEIMKRFPAKPSDGSLHV